MSAQTSKPDAYEYINWQEFYLWVGSILEIENRIPDWLIEILNERCRGFLEDERD